MSRGVSASIFDFAHDDAQPPLRLFRFCTPSTPFSTSLPPLTSPRPFSARPGPWRADSLRVGAALAAAGISESRVVFDPKIARGLDYYTGTVFETKLADLPDIGSVCSGGRYDELAGLYTKSHLPGIGASLGVDRILTALEDLGRIEQRATPARVFIPYFAKDRLADYFGLAAELRKAGLAVEVYPDSRKLGAQLKFADRRGHEVAIIVGDSEWESGIYQLKDLSTGDSTEVARAGLPEAINALLEPEA